MLGARDASGPRGGLVTTPLAGVSADEAVLHLRRKIGQRLKSGPHGLMRCWIQFRERAGSTKEGITYAEFKRGLKNYDLVVPEGVYQELFARMDKSGDGHIQARRGALALPRTAADATARRRALVADRSALGLPLLPLPPSRSLSSSTT